MLNSMRAIAGSAGYNTWGRMFWSLAVCTVSCAGRCPVTCIYYCLRNGQASRDALGLGSCMRM